MLNTCNPRKITLEKAEIENSVYISRERVTSMCEISSKKLLCCAESTMILLFNDWECVREFRAYCQINEIVKLQSFQKLDYNNAILTSPREIFIFDSTKSNLKSVVKCNQYQRISSSLSFQKQSSIATLSYDEFEINT